MNTSPEPLGSRVQVVVIDTRRLVRDGIQYVLRQSSDIDCLAHDADVSRSIAVVGESPLGWDASAHFAVVHLDSDRSPSTLAERIRDAARGAATSSPFNAPTTSDTRDRVLLHAARQGASNLELAERLGVSVRTAERYKQSLFRRLGATSPAHAVAVAVDRGLF